MPYTYLHRTADTGDVFYVGKGTGSRCYSKYSRNKFWHAVVNKHGGFVATVLAEWKTDADAFEHEKFLQKCFRDMGIRLTNIFECGSGLTSEAAKKLNLERVANGTHHYLGGQQVRQRVKDGTHHWLGKSQEASHRNKLLILKGLHPFFGIKGQQHCRDQLAAGTHPSQIKVSCLECGKTVHIGNFMQSHGAMCGKKQHSVGQRTCPHCGKTGGANNMPRYHFDNCKLKGIYHEQNS